MQLPLRKPDQAAQRRQSARAMLACALREWRHARGVPLKQLSAELGVSFQAVSAWETGERFPSPENLDALSHAMGIPVCRLFCQSGRIALCPVAAACFHDEWKKNHCPATPTWPT